ncbi:MAG: hypothetical protein E6H06_15230 [Bacteroidetes bacterium]|nr:MAG: hypothetical protein E6H06_15230 [Bacteroidota bacterium]
MKQIHTILYSMYDILLFVIVGIMLSSIIIIVVTNSWHYLFLYTPALIYIYKTRVINFRKDKHSKRTKKS